MDQYPETLVSMEWHSASFTPGNSDFDIPEYNTRSSYYGVGGIPHTQWNGLEETVGGYPNGNWQAFIGTFTSMYNNMVNGDTPYEIDINGYPGAEVSYNVTVSMDADMSSTNQRLHVFVVEDNIWSYWTGASQYHNARNVVREWLSTDDINISSEGESETFSGAFTLNNNWVSDSVKIIAAVQNFSTKEIFQVSQININDMNPDVDNDGVLNPVDNCIDTYNPAQEDLDMDLIGDACDPCNNLVYVTGNINGDINIIDGTPQIDIFDILTLSDHIQTGDFSDCQMPVVNINSDSHINILDVITLVQLVLNS